MEKAFSSRLTKVIGNKGKENKSDYISYYRYRSAIYGEIDVFMSGFAMMFFQDSSIFQFSKEVRGCYS